MTQEFPYSFKVLKILSTNSQTFYKSHSLDSSGYTQISSEIVDNHTTV